MPVSKRLRFEILKRDGFRCKYCGRTAVSIALEVDHVVPVSEEGTDDPENLITACFECNRGKGPVPLDESQIQEASPLEAAKEHAEQIRAYLAAQKEIAAARQEVADHLGESWRGCVGEQPPHYFAVALRGLADRYPLETLQEAIEATGRRGVEGTPVSRVKYFYGVLRGNDEGTNFQGRILGFQKLLEHIGTELELGLRLSDCDTKEIEPLIIQSINRLKWTVFFHGVFAALLGGVPEDKFFDKYLMKAVVGRKPVELADGVRELIDELGPNSPNTDKFWTLLNSARQTLTSQGDG